MANQVARSFFQVYIDGRQYLNKIMSVRVSHGFDQEYAEANVDVGPDMPNTVGKWSNIVIIMGRTSGEAFTRFNGFVWGFDLRLYPAGITIVCKGSVARAAEVSPEDEAVDYSGMTDQEVVADVLDRSGVIGANQNIQGTGRAIGTTSTGTDDTRFQWPSQDTGLDIIQRYDAISLGYRTMDSASGVVIRPLVNNIPTADPAAVLTEGIDLFDGTGKIDLKAPPNALEVRGPEIVFSYSQFNDWTPPNLQFVTASIRSQLLESGLAAEGVGISAEEVAQYFSGQWFDYKVTAEVTTWRSDLLAPGQTIEIHAPTRLRLSHYLFWLQTIVTEINEQGQFTQTLSLTTELTDAAPFNPNPIPGQAPPPPPTQNDAAQPAVNCDFAIIAIDKEKIIVDDAEQDLYIVYCEDVSTSTSSVTNVRSWTASAGGVPASGSDKIFVVAFQDLETASITLQVTMLSSATASKTKNLIDFAANIGVKTRKLYTAASSEFEVFDGETWRTDPPSTGTVVAAGNGPVAGTGAAPDVPTCTPTVSDGELFVRSSWEALVGTAWEERGVEANVINAIISQATDASNINSVGIEQGSPATPRVFTSTDGGLNWTVEEGTLPNSINSLVILYRNGKFHVHVFEELAGPGTVGGHYESVDGLAWTRNGMEAQLFGTEWWGADTWGATESHIYYIMRGDASGTGYHALMQDTETGTPETQTLQYSGSVTGGTFDLTFGFETQPSIPYNVDAATLQTALESFTGIGPGVVVTGDLSTGMDIVFPFNGPQQDITINDFSLTGGGTIAVTRSTPGTAGIRQYDTDRNSFAVWGSFTGDVAIVFMFGGEGSAILDVINAGAYSDGTPAFFTNGLSDQVTYLTSPDGVTWVGVYVNNDTAESQLMRSDDGGLTWALVGPVATWDIPSVVFDPVDNTRWLAIIKDAVDNAVVYVSTDNGATWADAGYDPFDFSDSALLVPIGGYYQ